jgi:hypothetical protein
MQTAPGEDPAVTMARCHLSFRGTKQAETRHDCIRRDGHRCVVTGELDRDYLTTQPGAAGHGVHGTYLECAYILPFALTVLNEANGIEVCFEWATHNRRGYTASRQLTEWL